MNAESSAVDTLNPTGSSAERARCHHNGQRDNGSQSQSKKAAYTMSHCTAKQDTHRMGQYGGAACNSVPQFK